MDKCLFMKSYIICIVYVYDKIIVRNNAKSIEEYIKGIGIWQDEQHHSFELCDKGEVGYFLGIHIEQKKDLKYDQRTHFKLSQPGLTNKILK